MAVGRAGRGKGKGGGKRRVFFFSFFLFFFGWWAGGGGGERHAMINILIQYMDIDQGGGFLSPFYGRVSSTNN